MKDKVLVDPRHQIPVSQLNNFLFDFDNHVYLVITPSTVKCKHGASSKCINFSGFFFSQYDL